MSDTQQIEGAQRKIANSGCLGRLVRLPRMESPKWIRLGQNLDLIRDDIGVAIHKGFVRGKTKILDERLTNIIQAAKDALELLRPNAGTEARGNRVASGALLGMDSGAE